MYEGDRKKDKTVFLHLVWGDTRRYGGVGRKSPCSCLINLADFGPQRMGQHFYQNDLKQNLCILQ